jgi:hypothetical protein
VLCQVNDGQADVKVLLILCKYDPGKGGRFEETKTSKRSGVGTMKRKRGKASIGTRDLYYVLRLAA